MAVFVDSGEREAIRRTARGFCRERLPVGHLRRLRDDDDPLGLCPARWREAAELGWAGVLVSEDCGGLGLGMVDAGILLEECGRTLAPTPMLSTGVIGATALAGAGDALAAIAAGDMLCALALEERPRFAPYDLAATAARCAGGWVIDGAKANVLDGPAADQLIVVARLAGGDLAVFRVDAAAARVERRVRVDSRSAAAVRLDAVEVSDDRRLGGRDLLDAVLDRATAALAAEMLGGIREAFARTLAYLGERTQFGAPIGSFQALKHRAARMFCEVELTASVVRAALDALDADAPDAPALVSAAKARASDTYIMIANEAVQMHGGIGVTDELDIGLYLKRARVAAMTFGDAAYHRDRFGRLSGY